MNGQNYSEYSVYVPINAMPVPEITIIRIPTPRKVSQKERRRKARRLRSQGLKWRVK